jgi:hypothetical protein
MEFEKGIELLFLGAYYKYATTAFVTFNSRVTESIAHQVLLIFLLINILFFI